MSAYISLRNKISRQATQYPAAEAEAILAHPVWGKHNEVVRTPKPEVLKTAESAPAAREDKPGVVEATRETPSPADIKKDSK